MIQRKFIPGSQWLYFKIYTGVKTADEVLAHTIRPFLRELYAERWIDGSFFIRYNDPDFHIRLRLHIDRFENYAPIFRCFEASFQPLVESGAIIFYAILTSVKSNGTGQILWSRSNDCSE